MATAEVVATQGAVVRQEFGANEIQRSGETAATAVAAQAEAAVKARYWLAIQRPRDWEDVRVRLEKECHRPGFADSAWYRKPIGQGVEGFSIRFAEAALRCMTNCYPETLVVFEDDRKRIIQVGVTDLESNLTYTSQIVINKTVERRQLKDGQQPISQRVNSTGQTVYLVEATEDDLLNKQNALISKALRTNALRLMPGDILDRCENLILKTRQDKAAQDPDAQKRALVDAFHAQGITPADLMAYLGHSLDRVQPAELVELRSVYTAIKDGETKWDDVMEHRSGVTGSKDLQQEVLERKLAEARAAGQTTETPPTAEGEKQTPTQIVEGFKFGVKK